MAELLRIQKYLADCGVCSRRAAETAIANGMVTVNDKPCEIGQKIDPENDRVFFDGREILPAGSEKHYVLLNKPRGIVCTAKDEKGRTPVTDLVRLEGVRLYPVGRLDMDSDGLLLLTDDGNFANRLTHPRHEIPKIYEVTFALPPSAEQLRALEMPMELDGYALLPVGLRPLAPDKLEITLWEGRNRQIRRMCEAVGLKITRLCRVGIGEIRAGGLQPGKWRFLTSAEVQYLFWKYYPFKKKRNRSAFAAFATFPTAPKPWHTTPQGTAT